MFWLFFLLRFVKSVLRVHKYRQLRPWLARNGREKYRRLQQLLTQCYYHRGTRLNAMKRFCIFSYWSHLNVLTFFPPDWGMLRRSRCIQIFLLNRLIGRRRSWIQTFGLEIHLFGINNLRSSTSAVFQVTLSKRLSSLSCNFLQTEVSGFEGHVPRFGGRSFGWARVLFKPAANAKERWLFFFFNLTYSRWTS